MAKQKYIDDKLYNMMLETWENAESYSKQDIQEFLVEQGYICEKLKNELIEKDRCPICFNNLVPKVIGYENSEYQGFAEKEPICIKACKDDSCGFQVS